MAFIFNTPSEVALALAKRVADCRLGANITQRTLSERSGVSYAVIRKFERTGKISLESLLKIALVLDALKGFEDVFNNQEQKKYASLDALMNEKTRKRGRL